MNPLSRPALARAAYNALLCAALPLALCRLLWRSRADAMYRRRVAERLGRYAQPPPDSCVWFHAVSVGELLAALPLLEALRRDRADATILLTTTTPAASRLLRARLGERVLHVYAPWDLPWIVGRFLGHFRPRAAIMIETELWPNQVDACAARGIPLLLLNARLSDRSARRYRRAGGFACAMMGSLHGVAAQSEADAARFRALGVPAAAVTVTGSLKWDAEPSLAVRDEAIRLRAAWRGRESRPVWLAASTHPGEETVLLDALRALLPRHPRLLLVLAPRDAARAAALAEQARAGGLSARLHGAAAADGAQLIVVDSVGELPLLCGAADLVFVGGSLVARGGHNLAEPAVWGLPLLSGPSLFNFSAMSASLAAAGALRIVADGAQLAQAVDGWLRDEPGRLQAGAAARAVVEANRGALARSLALLERLL